MKRIKCFFLNWASWVILGLLLGATGTARGATTFSFTLDEPCKTSAGVFAPDGTLVRTLWSKVRYPAGTNSAVWDGLDDSGNAAPTGVYQIKLLQHNTEYVWDGAIGNTSAEKSGPTVHKGFWPMRDMAISGTNAFYVSGYNEGGYDFRSFLTTDPQHVTMSWFWVYSAQFNRSSSVPGDVYDRNWLWTTTDGNWVYFGCSSTLSPLTQDDGYAGCVVACKVSDKSPASFTTGEPIDNGPDAPFPGGIYVGTQGGLSGLSVQQNGNLLAVAVAPDNRVYLVDKLAGSPIANFSVNSPGRLNFSPDGSLWVVSGNSVIRFTNLTVNPTAALTIPNLAGPLDVAVNPNSANLVLVADGGSSQQVKAFDSSGNSLWVYGLPGGYAANGVAVSTNKFWFFDGENNGTFICFASDNTFWVGDGGNHRSMRFSGAGNYLEQIMFQPHSYIASVDPNNPGRVFNEFLEFQVDYTKPLPQAWTLVNNWKVGVDPAHISWDDGIYEVTTFTNGHTYALIDNNNASPPLHELCELATNGLRLTGIFPILGNGGRWISLGPDGSARGTTIGGAQWYESTLAGFDTHNNPLWNPEFLLASASQNPTDPFTRCCGLGYVRAPISTNNILITFDPSLNNGWHLGGIRAGANKWLWKASPAVTYMNGCGTYEIANGLQYGGNNVQAVDRNVIFGFHGEFFRSEGQAAQHMHFYDDGLFVGQFGEASPGHYDYEGALPGFAGNGGSPTLIKTTNGDYYLWVNDESAHGPQRWHFANAKNIREQTGSGTLGNPIVLTNQFYNFPTGVAGKHGYQSGELSWLPVTGASSYKIRYSLMNGGPYSNLAGNPNNLDFVVSGLTNGLTYYFVVTAIIGGTEGTTSEQVEIRPFDTNQPVLCVGHMIEGGQFTPVIEVSSTNADAGLAAWIGAEQFTGVLNLRELCYYGYGDMMNQFVGAKGFALYDFGGAGSSLTHLLASFTVTPASGWIDYSYLEKQYRADNVLGANVGWTGWAAGNIAIGVSDNNYHYLTVVSPAQFNNPRVFTMKITSTNGTSAFYKVNDNPGYSHTFQFLFRGNIILTADATGGADGVVQALFLDNDPLASTPLPPPSHLHIVVPK